MNATRIDQTCPRCGALLAGGESCLVCLLEEGLEPPSAPVAVETDTSTEPLRPDSEWVGDYELLDEAGRGGMGVIYTARQRHLNRVVALKMLLAGEFAEATARERLLREAKIAAALSHPNIVTIHEVGEHQGRPFFVMEYVPGSNLAQIVKTQTIPFRKAALYLEELARAVAYAHGQGVVHRDLKPSNVLITPEDRPKLTDFGLTRSASEASLSFESAGTPNFMAPEQAGAGHAATGPHTDVFGLGAILYYLLTGRAPFLGESLAQTIRAVVDEEPTPPGMLRAGVPRDLETICLKCLEKEPERRYRTADELAEDLHRWRHGHAIHARPVSRVERALKLARRHPLASMLSAALLLVLIAGLTTTTWQWRQAEQQRERTERENYIASVNLAASHLAQGDVQAARDLLLKQPEKLRHWEWGHLLKETYPDLLTLRFFTNVVLTNYTGMRVWHNTSGDGKLLAIWGDDTVRVARTRDGALLWQFGDATNKISFAAFSPNSDELITGGPGPGFTLWSLPEFRPLTTLDDATEPDRRFSFSPDGRHALSTSRSTEVLIWDYPARRLLHRLNSGVGPVWGARFSEDGSRVFSERTGAQPGRQQEVWSVDTGESIARFPSEPMRYIASIMAGDAMHYVTISTNRVAAVWKLGNSEPLFETAAESRQLVTAAISVKHQRLATLSYPNQLRFWDYQAKRILSSPPGRVNEFVIADDDTLITAGGERFARVWDWESGSEFKRLITGDAQFETVGRATPDGRFISVSSRAPDGTALVHLWSSSSSTKRLGHWTWPSGAALSPDGKKIAAGHFTKDISVWDAESGQQYAWLDGHWRWVRDQLWSHDGTRLYTASLDHTVRIWDGATGAPLLTLTNHNRAVINLALSADDRVLASADLGGWINVFDTRSGSLLRSWRSVTNLARLRMALSPDGKWLASCDFMLMGGVWDTRTGEKEFAFSEHPLEQPVSAVFSADGKTLVTCAINGDLVFRETGSWRLLRTVPGRGVGTEMAFSGDGQRLFVNRADAPNSGAGMAAVHIHEARTGQFILSIGNVPATSLSMNFAPKANRLIRTAISDFPQFGGVFQWDALPWSDAAYANAPGQSLEERIAHVAREELWKSTVRPTPIPLAQPPWRQPRSHWKPRDPAAPGECVDLTDFYNGHLETGWEPIIYFDAADNNLASLPQGLVTLGGVPWDIRGVITLGRPELFPHVVWPAGKAVEGIRIGRKCARLHFLHALSFATVEADVVARYRLRYSDGTAADLPIRLGLDAGDWWSSNQQSRASEGAVAWEGENLYAARQANARARVFHRSWDNPFPEKEIVSFDFISEHDTVVPFLIAVTVE